MPKFIDKTDQMPSVTAETTPSNDYLRQRCPEYADLLISKLDDGERLRQAPVKRAEHARESRTQTLDALLQQAIVDHYAEIAKVKPCHRVGELRRQLDTPPKLAHYKIEKVPSDESLIRALRVAGLK